MSKRVTGAALNRKIVRELRDELATDYGLPMSEYDVTDVYSESIGSDMQPIMSVVFTRRANGRRITVDSIDPNDDGTIATRSADIQFR